MALFLHQIFSLYKLILYILFCVPISVAAHPQFVSIDSTPGGGTYPTKEVSTFQPSSIITDSVSATKDSLVLKDRALARNIIAHHPYFNIYGKASYPPYTQKVNQPGKEIFFYTLMGILLFFAILKARFSKYFSDLLHFFFRRSLKQKQLKQQILQDSLPSLMFNIFFVVVVGFFGAIAIQRTTPDLKFPFWELLSYTTIGVGLIYLAKFFILKIIGWVFSIQKLTDNYTFIIFVVNKVLALLLLPLLLFIVLANKELSTVAWTLSWICIGSFILYRYVSSLKIIQMGKDISFFHFLLYIVAFEILPTVILYKGMATFIK